VAAATGTKFEMQRRQGMEAGKRITNESTANQPRAVVDADLLLGRPTEPLNEKAKFEFGGNASDVTLKVYNGRHYATMPDGVSICYRLLGNAGPCVAFIPGGQNGICDFGMATGSDMFTVLGQVLPKCGYRVLLHDRRNTGFSDIGYAAGRAIEAELQAQDLHLLLERLGLGPAVLVGNSSGGRLSLLLARLHPSSIRALVLMNLTGGKVAAQNLSHQYYRRYISLAQSTRGMEAIANTDHYADLCKAIRGTHPVCGPSVQKNLQKQCVFRQSGLNHLAMIPCAGIPSHS